MAGRILEDVDEEKDLGVLIDKELKLHRQTASTVKKANSSLWVSSKKHLHYWMIKSFHYCSNL